MLMQPLGLKLEEDERGNVYIVDIIPGGNASRKSSQINVSCPFFPVVISRQAAVYAVH